MTGGQYDIIAQISRNGRPLRTSARFRLMLVLFRGLAHVLLCRKPDAFSNGGRNLPRAGQRGMLEARKTCRMKAGIRRAYEEVLHMKALVVIDYTVDFVTGKLPVGEPAIAIEDRIAALTEQFVKNGDFVVMAVDLHDEGDQLHPEHKLFPPHNIRGTDGRRLYGKLERVVEVQKHALYWAYNMWCCA